MATTYGGGITGLGNETVTVSDGDVTAANLNTINAGTSVNVIATAVTNITGSRTELATTYGGGMTGLGDETITVSDAKYHINAGKYH